MATTPIPKEKFEGQNLALHQAARADGFNDIRRLVSEGLDIDAKDGNGCTPLIYACGLGNLSSVKELLSLNADPTIKDDLGYDAYHTAMFYGDFKGMTTEPFNEIMNLIEGAK